MSTIQIPVGVWFNPRSDYATDLRVATGRIAMTTISVDLAAQISLAYQNYLNGEILKQNTELKQIEKNINNSCRHETIANNAISIYKHPDTGKDYLAHLARYEKDEAPFIVRLSPSGGEFFPYELAQRQIGADNRVKFTTITNNNNRYPRRFKDISSALKAAMKMGFK